MNRLCRMSVPPQGWPFYCPYCPHCRRIAPLLQNGLPQSNYQAPPYFPRVLLPPRLPNPVPIPFPRIIAAPGPVNPAPSPVIPAPAPVIPAPVFPAPVIPASPAADEEDEVEPMPASPPPADDEPAPPEPMENEVLEEDGSSSSPSPTDAPQRCRPDCRCCDTTCPCSKSKKCICICHKKKKSKADSWKLVLSSSSDDSSSAGPSSAPGPSSAGPSAGPSTSTSADSWKLIYSPSSDSTSDALLTADAPVINCKLQLRPSSKRKRSSKEEEVEEGFEYGPKHFKNFEPEAIVRGWGVEGWKNEPNGDEVPRELKLLGYKRLPPVLGDRRKTRGSSYLAAMSKSDRLVRRSDRLAARTAKY